MKTKKIVMVALHVIIVPFVFIEALSKKENPFQAVGKMWNMMLVIEAMYL